MKKCKQCKERFEPTRPMQVVCSSKCAIEYARAGATRALQRAIARKDKLEYRRANVTVRAATKKAQAAFNKYIRLRDAGLPCISCGALPEQKRGGTMDAGHYRGVGPCPQLRFCEKNAHAQCVRCNRDLSGNSVEYRKGLITRYGAELVAWLEGPHELERWRVPELQHIESVYRAKSRALASRENSQVTIPQPEEADAEQESNPAPKH